MGRKRKSKKEPEREEEEEEERGPVILNLRGSCGCAQSWMVRVASSKREQQAVSHIQSMPVDQSRLLGENKIKNKIPLCLAVVIYTYIYFFSFFFI